MSRIKLKSILLCAGLSLFNLQALSAECIASTGNQTTSLLALYTSEGCSSCPPADKWLSKLDIDQRNLTALAFHVDYWDYIGWKDQFAKAEYSNRQRQTAKFNGASFVYTPQFVLNGQDFKRWNNRRLLAAIHEIQQKPSRAQLSLRAVNNADGSITLKTAASATKNVSAKQIDIYIALYENNLTTKVKAGENKGRELTHDYVVRQLLGGYPLNLQKPFTKSFNLGKSWQGKDAGAVIFVQDSTNGQIMQSLALDFCS